MLELPRMLGIFLDSETNGLNPKIHRILEIAFKVIDVETGRCECAYEALVRISDEDWAKSDPNSLEVNGFTKELNDQGRPDTQVAGEIKNIFIDMDLVRGKSVFICQNPSFDRAFFAHLIPPQDQEKLKWPYHWLDLASMYWGKAVSSGSELPWEKGFTKDKIAKAHNIPSEEKPHRAGRGVDHLVACYEAVLGFPKKG